MSVTEAKPAPAVEHPRRRAAVIATAITVPLVVAAALIIGNATDTKGPKSSSATGPLPAVTAAAPPTNAANEVPCTSVLEALPTQLDGLDARQVVSNPSSPFVVGWGNPAVVLRCGVARPAELHPASTTDFQLISPPSGTAGVYWDVTSRGSDEIYTSVDRAVYIEVSVPSTYGAGPMPALSGLIAQALPAVCVGGQAESGTLVPTDQLCTHRP